MDDAVDLVVTGHTHAAYNCSADTPQDLDTLADYLAAFKAPSSAPYDPAAASLLKPRIVRLP